MSINDQNRSRKTYSFFRAPPVAAASTVVSGGLGILVTGDKNHVVISFDPSTISGTLYFAGAGMSLRNNNTFDLNLGAGTGISFTTGSGNSLTINSSGGGGSSNGWIDGGGKMKTTGSISIDAGSHYATQVGTDVFFFVSGSQGLTGSNSTRQVAVFGGDVVISGTLAGAFKNVVTLEQFGAAGTGLVDDSAAFMAALTASIGGGAIVLGANKTYWVNNNAPFLIPASSSIIGWGDSSILKITKDAALLIPNGEFTTFSSFKIQGSGASFANQIGIANQNLGAGGGTAFHNMRIDSVTFDSLGAAGVLTYQGAAVAPYYNTQINNCRAYQCGRGLWMLHEYTTVTNFQADTCGTGIECETGNQVYVGGTLTNCAIGFLLDGGGNDAHGVVTGMSINHNATNLKVYFNEANGEKFVDCMFYSGDILLQNTHAVQFIGCQIDVPNYYFDNAIGTVFEACTFPNSATANTIHNSYNGNTSTTRWINCFDLNGNVPAFITQAQDGTNWTNLVNGSMVVSGTLLVSGGISGSHTTLANGSSFLVAGSNVTITSSSNGQVVISSTGGSGGGSSGWVDGGGKMKTTGSVSVDASNRYASAIGTDVFFFVSGSTLSSAGSSNRHVAVFSDVVSSGTLQAGGGTNYYALIGPDSANPNLESAVWLLPPGTAANGTNMSLLYNGSATYLNSPANFISFTSNGFGINLAWMQGNLSQFYLWNMPNFTWDPGGGAPILWHVGRTSNASAGAFTVHAQDAYSAASVANQNGGNVVLMGGAAASSTGSAGQIVHSGSTTTFLGPDGVQRAALSASTHGQLFVGGGGSDFMTMMGPMPSFESSDSGFWALPPGTAPTSANSLFYADASNCIVNAPGGAGSIYFYQHGATEMALFSPLQLTTFMVTMAWDQGTGAPTIKQNAANSGAGTSFTIQAQAGSGSNKGGDLQLYAGTTTGNGTTGQVIASGSLLSVTGSLSVNVPSTVTNGGALVNYGNVPSVRMGTFGGTITAAGIWFTDAGNPTTSNWAFLASSGDSYFNSTNNLYFKFGNATFAGSANVAGRWEFGGTIANSVAPVAYFDWTSSPTTRLVFNTQVTASIVQTAATSGAGATLTIQAQQGSGSNAGGDLVLSGGLGGGRWLSVPGTVAVLGAVRYTNRTLTGSYVIDTIGADQTLFLSGTTTGPVQSNVVLTLPPPVQGRRLTFKDTVGILNAGGTGSGIASWAITGSNGAKFIEALTSSYGINAPFQRVTLEADGTAWWVTG